MLSEQRNQRREGQGPPDGRPELPKQYKPTDHEGRIRAAWDASGVFHADPERVAEGQAKPYCIVIPPPNVTDRLHLGHALNNTLQDVLIRAHRMMGNETLWMPGTDHAGIATQAVVERRLRKEGQLTGPLRESMKREDFVAKVQAFKDEYEATITGQLKAMGCSCDWARQRFTMDPVCAHAVYEAFFRLFRDGLIYRGKRLVNWDPVLQTAVADDETEDIEVDGHMHYLRYPLVHNHGASTSRERAQGAPPPGDAVPVTWSELRALGYTVPDDAGHEDEAQAWITVATTRPETYLGDTAVAVNPHDPRAKALRGLSVELPLVGRVIPIVEDDYVVLPAAMQKDREAARSDPKAAIATGFLKVTPGHDPNDYALGTRHGLDIVNVMAPDASISDKHGWTDVGDAHIFVGKSREEARTLVLKEFKARGLLQEIRPYRHSVPHSDRSKAAIEPYLSDQWYVKVTDDRLAPAANRALVSDQRSGPTSQNRIAAPGDGALRFHPPRYARTYETWHDNIRDWCISRQLWWGHRIPVWVSPKAWTVPPDDAAMLDRLDALRKSERIWFHEGFALREGVEQATPGTHEPAWAICVRDPLDRETTSFLDACGLQRDPDVLDTWFSSALWPISTLGWPDPTAAGPEFAGMLEAFNPSSALCTAREIITLWVSRMVMFNRYFRGQDLGAGPGHGPVPFKDVFIHAMIQDGEGRKMSKSLGNGVDPLDIIASHGADAMRFTLVHMTTQTQDVRMPVEPDPRTGRNTSPKFDLGRNFCNKLWNAARFAIGILESPASTQPAGPRDALALPDRWMLSRLAAGVAAADTAIREFQFSDYAQTLYDLLWRDFCDWYLEAIKPTVSADPRQRAVLANVLDSIVRLLHPIAPFITEAIWERLRDLRREATPGIDLTPARSGTLLATASWPRIQPGLRDPEIEREFEALRGLVTAVREVRAQHNVPPKRRITLHIPTALESALHRSLPLAQTLAGIETVTISPPQGAAVAFSYHAAECHLSNLADAVDAGAERARLEKAVADARRTIDTLEKRLANPGYSEKAPPAMVQQTRDQLAKAKAELEAHAEAMRKLV